MKTLEQSRPTIGAQAVGIAQAALDASVAYAKERRAFDQPIAAFQGIQFMLADMAIAVHASRLVVHHAAALIDHGITGAALESSVAKCLASDTAMKAATDAVQILGGYGYTQGVSGGALHARRQDHPDLRGHEPDPASGHRPAAPGQVLTRIQRGILDERPTPATCALAAPS